MTKNRDEEIQAINEIREEYFSNLSKEHELPIDEIKKIFNECEIELISKGGYKARQFMGIALVSAIERYKKAKQEGKS